MIASLAASFGLVSVLLALGAIFGRDRSRWPRLYVNAADRMRRTLFFYLHRAIEARSAAAWLVHVPMLLICVWFLTCFLFAATQMLGGFFQMDFFINVFTFLVGLFIISVTTAVIFGLFLHASQYPLALAAVRASRGGFDRNVVACLSLASGAAAVGLLIWA